MCSGSEAGSCLSPIDFLYHSTLGLRVIQKKKREATRFPRAVSASMVPHPKRTRDELPERVLY